MELGQHQLQFVVSLLVIVGAACVALVCDFLKRNNEELRELTLELKVRREEEQKRTQLLTPPVAERVERPKPEQVEAPAAPAVAAAPKQRSAVAAVTKDKKRAVNSDALAAMERGAALASSGGRPRSVTPAPVAEPKPEVVETQPVKIAAKKDWGSLLSRNAAPKAH